MSDLKDKAMALGFHGIVARWEEYFNQPWLPGLLQDEEAEQARRSMARRLKEAKLGQYKPMAEFDWSWPTKIDRELIEEIFTLLFMQTATNVVFMGTNGLAKTMITQNLVYQALLAGHSARFIKASELLDELAAADGAFTRRRCLKKYSQVGLLAIDEVGYLSYDNHYADLLYEVITARYQKRSTIVTTNRLCGALHKRFNAECILMLTLLQTALSKWSQLFSFAPHIWGCL